MEEVCRVAAGQGEAIPSQQLLVGLEAVVAQQRPALGPQPPTALAWLQVHVTVLRAWRQQRMTYRHRLAQQRVALRPRPATVSALPFGMCKSRDASVTLTVHGLSPQTCSAARLCCGKDAFGKASA